ncbi:hypothetical protein AKJ42_01670 [candidate division MSBL1 archaeon SCGC-AAA261C02]|uniref:Uncharacterized protein n=1 Tax=candidate division MSBL1 archaeon SCGC-AAA261C02 TaxID=1698272 RepID=A0A133V113_9EURY|nr:hypothetical protein AKJ42_01670 [candidate division MSBL1 archaeon SCGC-AAA261C02]
MPHLNKGRKLEKGQFSIEFIIVLGVLLTLIASVSLPLYENSSAKARKLTRLSQAREAGNELVSALNTVYAGGVGAKQTIEYSLPSSVRQIRIDEDVDGTDSVPQDNRMDVQIEMDWEEDNVVLINTLIPSQYQYGEGEEVIPVIDAHLSESHGDHTVVVSYENYPTIVLEEV